MGHLVFAWIGEETPYPSDLTVDGMDPVPGPHLCLAQRNNVLDDRPVACRRAAEVDEAASASAGCERLAADVVYQGIAEKATGADAVRAFS